MNHLPSGTSVAAARRSSKAEDLSSLMQLVQHGPSPNTQSCSSRQRINNQRNSVGDDCSRVGIVVEHLPTETILAIARRTSELKDLAVIVQLIKLAISRNDRLCSRVRSEEHTSELQS